jgi:esterase/lipase
MNKTRDHILHRPSGLNSAFTYTGEDFQGYINHTRAIIEKSRADLATPIRERIIAANCPFEYKPQPNAYNPEKKKYKQGVLLIHGLFDSPCSLHSVAEQLQQKGYLVRAILLPGHGTVPADLLEVTYQQWLKAVRFASHGMAQDTEQFYLCGFSTGAALALNDSHKNPSSNLKGLILLAPAIQIRRGFRTLSVLHKWLNHCIGGRMNWFARRSDQDYSRYHSIPYNAVHQVYLLIKENQRSFNHRPIKIPLFMAVSLDDELLDLNACLGLFTKSHHPHNQCILYANDTVKFKDPRIELRKSARPKEKILDLSHVAMPIAPDHFHYGKHGDYQDFQHYPEVLREHLRQKLARGESDNIYYGAIQARNLARHYIFHLTYNPDFAYMMEQMDCFMGR